MPTKKGITRTLQGVVVSNRMEKTIVVRVDRERMHTKYRKQYRVTRRFHVHDERSQYRAGDRVTFVAGRPFSKTKRWRVVYAESQKSKVKSQNNGIPMRHRDEYFKKYPEWTPQF